METNVIQNFIINTSKSCAVLLISSIAFVIIITAFPLIGSLTIENFPIKQVISDNFKLLIPISIVCILVSPVFGLATTKLKRKRFLYLFLLGIATCWLAIIAVMFSWSGSLISENTFSTIALSAWALLAYSLFSLPILIPAVFIINKWTEKNFSSQ